MALESCQSNSTSRKWTSKLGQAEMIRKSLIRVSLTWASLQLSSFRSYTSSLSFRHRLERLWTSQLSCRRTWWAKVSSHSRSQSYSSRKWMTRNPSLTLNTYQASARFSSSHRSRLKTRSSETASKSLKSKSFSSSGAIETTHSPRPRLQNLKTSNWSSSIWRASSSLTQHSKGSALCSRHPIWDGTWLCMSCSHARRTCTLS